MKQFIVFQFAFLYITLSFCQPSISDSSSLEAYFDGVINTHLRDKHVPGATLAFVQDGRISLLKGYGYADLEKRSPVDPEKTLFRIGSVSKLFTWLAIMQQYERGNLSLDDDINKYFKDFKVPDTYDEKITIKDLMTHTPGFEDEIIGLFAKDESAMRPLNEILTAEMPMRVRPPGTIASYSNHGTGMAAYIVEGLSSKDFNTYIEDEFLKPLEMNYATLRQPLPDHLAPYMSKGYAYVNGEFVMKDFEFVPLGPVGGVSASAASMAPFMLMFLNNGTLNRTTIIDSSTFALMKSAAHQHHPAVNPMRHGFMDMSQNGIQIIGHGGDTFWFHTLFAFFPDHGFGIFLSFNGDQGGGTYMDVLEDFVDRYFPEKVPEATSGSSDDLKLFEGEYIINRYSYDDILKIGRLMSIINISRTEDGRLKTVLGQQVNHWVQQSDLVFRNVESTETLAFQKNEDGEIVHGFFGGLPIMALDKATGWHKSGIQIALLIICPVVLLMTFLYWLISFFFRRTYQIHREPQTILPKNTKRVAWWSISFVLLFYLGLALLFSDPLSTVFGLPGYSYVIFTIPFIVLILTLILIYKSVHLWRTGSYVHPWRKVMLSVICLCLIITMVQWNYWNLLGYHF